MNWVAIAVGAGAGVAAVLISAGILRLLGRRNFKGANVLYVVIFAAALALGREFVEPRIQAQRVESALLDMPVYRALQQYEPEAYGRIRSAMESGITSKLPLEKIWAATRPVVGEVTARQLPHASDDVLVKFGQHVVLTLDLLHSKGGNVCFSYINPAPGEALDFTVLLGKEIAQQELNLVAELVVSAGGKTRPRVTEAQATPDVEVVVGKLLSKYSQEDLAALQNPNSPNVDKRKYCRMIADLYKEAIALPTSRNGQLLRYLMQGQ
jgi:hypothetical protein